MIRPGDAGHPEASDRPVGSQAAFRAAPGVIGARAAGGVRPRAAATGRQAIAGARRQGEKRQRQAIAGVRRAEAKRERRVIAGVLAAGTAARASADVPLVTATAARAIADVPLVTAAIAVERGGSAELRQSRRGRSGSAALGR